MELQNRVRELMSRVVVGAEPSMSVADALQLLSEHSVSHLPVISAGRVVGVLCSCDLDSASLMADVSTVMHSPPACIEPDQSLAEAAASMNKLGVGSLVVESDHQIVGVVTRGDFERAGLAEQAFPTSRCAACKSFQHVHVDAGGMWWCPSCRASRGPPARRDELGQPG